MGKHGTPGPMRRMEIAKRRAEVADLYLQGWSQAEISVRYDVSRSAIAQDIVHIQKEWKASRIRNLDELKTQELRRLDRTEREAWTAWERSKGPQEITEASQRGDAKGAKRVVKTSAGNPRFLGIVTSCIAQRCRILGLEAPTKIETDAKGNDLEQQRREARAKFPELLAAMRERAGRGNAGDVPGVRPGDGATGNN